MHALQVVPTFVPTSRGQGAGLLPLGQSSAPWDKLLEDASLAGISSLPPRLSPLALVPPLGATHKLVSSSIRQFLDQRLTSIFCKKQDSNIFQL